MSEHGSRRAAPSPRGGRRSSGGGTGGFGDKLNELVGTVQAKFADLRGGGGGRGGRGSGPGGPGRGPDRGRGRGDDRPLPPKDWWMKFVDYPRYGRRGWRHWMPSIKQILACFMVFVFMVIGLIGWVYSNTQTPDMTTAHYIAQDHPTRFTYDDGNTDFAHIGLSYFPVDDINKVPKVVQNAVIAAEDKTFRDNSGVSFTGVARAALSDVFGGGGSTQGGSTITQQFVKNAFLSQDQTFNRKINEIMMSIKLSHKYSKDDILKGYLNQISFGRGAYGIDAASRLYLGVPVSQIKETDLNSAAFLATLINNPSVFANALVDDTAQAKHPKTMEVMKARYNQVLANMREYGFAQPDPVHAAQDHLPKILPQAASSDNLGGYVGYMKEAATAYLARMVQQYPSDKATQQYANIDQLSKGGYTIVTTYNKQMMDDSIAAADAGFWKGPKVSYQGQWNPGKSSHTADKDVHVAFASVDPQTGYVKSFYNGVDGVEDYLKNPFNAALDGGIQVGSTFKAITLATALETGKYSLDSTEPGSNTRQLYWPIGSTGDNNKLQFVNQYGQTKIWPPNEDDESVNGLNGMATLRQGMAMSLNSVFADLEMEPDVTPGAVYQMAQKLGIKEGTGDFNANPSLTLGVATITPMRMASAYGTFAAQGVHNEPIQVKEIRDAKNNVVWRPPVAVGTSKVVAMSQNSANGVTEALQGVLKDGGTAAGNQSAADFAASVDYKVAGKTGTTDYNHSAWFNGYSTGLATAVAVFRQTPSGILESLRGVGYNWANSDQSGSSGRVNGMSYPTSIWTAFMKGQLAKHPNWAGSFQQYNPVCTGVNGLAAQNNAANNPPQNQGGTPGSGCANLMATATPTPTAPTGTTAPPATQGPTQPQCTADQNGNCPTGPETPTDSGTQPTGPPSSTTPPKHCRPLDPLCNTSSGPSSPPSSGGPGTRPGG